MAVPSFRASALGPFSDTRWHKSPTAQEIASGFDLYLPDASPTPSLLALPRVSDDYETSDDNDSVNEIGPVTPCTPGKTKHSAAYLSSPFWDKRWKRGPEEEGYDLGVDAEAEGPERVNLLDLDLAGAGVGVRSGSQLDEGRHGSSSAKEECGDEAREEPSAVNISEESEEDDRDWSGLRRNLWPKSSQHIPKRREKGRGLEEELVWASEHPIVSTTPIAHSCPHSTPIPAHSNDLVPTTSSQRIDPASFATPSSPCIAAHLSSRLGHAKMLEAALRLVEEHMMGGLSLFLYCPKRHVREMWGAEKIWDVRDKLDAMDRLSPGFKQRIFVHSHETMNLACRPSDLGQPESIERGSIVHGQTMDSLRREMRTLELLGLRYIVVHPGSSSRCGGGGDDTKNLQLVASNIDRLLGEHPTLTIVLESMACKNGKMVGTSLSSLALIRAFSAYPSRIRYCIDLCHIHAMSHNLSTVDGRKRFFDDVESWLGYENVVCGHISESALPHASGRGRHADFGSGYIGDQAFRDILRNPSLSHITWIIETPRYLPHSITNQAVETLEIKRQALDIGHLRQISSISDGGWTDAEGKGKMQERREDDTKRLRREMMRAAGKEGASKREIEDRARQSRRRRGRIYRAIARAQLENTGSAGIKRSPKREREAKLAKERYKLRRISSSSRVGINVGAR